MLAIMSRPATLGDLRASGWESRPVKEEIRSKIGKISRELEKAQGTRTELLPAERKKSKEEHGPDLHPTDRKQTKETRGRRHLNQHGEPLRGTCGS